LTSSKSSMTLSSFSYRSFKRVHGENRCSMVKTATCFRLLCAGVLLSFYVEVERNPENDPSENDLSGFTIYPCGAVQQSLSSLDESA
jgi:hypothetical protein